MDSVNINKTQAGLEATAHCGQFLSKGNFNKHSTPMPTSTQLQFKAPKPNKRITSTKTQLHQAPSPKMQQSTS